MASLSPHEGLAGAVLEKHLSVRAAAKYSGYNEQYLRHLLRAAPSSAACGFRSEAELDLNRLKSEKCPKNPPDWQVGCNELLAGTPVQLRSLVL